MREAFFSCFLSVNVMISCWVLNIVRVKFHSFGLPQSLSLGYVDLNSLLSSLNVMISCYVLALWVLNMRVKFHSLGLPQSLSLEMEIRIYLLLPVKRVTFEAMFTLMRR